MISVGSVTVAAMTVLPGVPERVMGDSFILVATIIAWVFSAGYWKWSQWRIYPAGRAILYLLLSFAVFGTQVSMSNWIGTDYWGWAQIRMCVYAGIMFTSFNLLWTWNQERTRNDDLPPHL
jgi:hypothetical protein